MLILNTPNINEARKQIDKLRKQNKDEKIAVLSQSDEFNRKALEIKNLNILIINENLNQRDYSKQRNSGLNEVLAKICKEKGIEIGVQIDEITKKPELEKAKSLARLSQNIMLCKKAGAKLIFLSNNIIDKRALQSLMLVLGAGTKQAEQIEFPLKKSERFK
jgi:RNase P/RNase MRP subunit p30